MSERENYLRTIEMREPEWIPCNVSFLQPAWHKYREKIEDIILRHPSIFGEYVRGSHDFNNFGSRRRGHSYKDEWGCTWSFLINGLQGQVRSHPLEDWSAFQSHKPPDPSDSMGPPREGSPPNESWSDVKKRIRDRKGRGKIAYGYFPHGFLFQRLYYLRGFKNLMIDLITEPPQLEDLIGMINEYNLKLLEMWLQMDVDIMYFEDDLGTQTRMMISVETFRKYLLPAYSEIFRRVREAGVHVHMHSDGHIIEAAEDLINAGASILGLQSRENGIKNIRRTCKGKVCISLYLDSQVIIPMGTFKEIEDHVREAILNLGSKSGGLILHAECNVETPLANCEALCQALEKYQQYFSIT